MSGRTNPEWIGGTPDTKIPDHVKLRIWDREGGLCYLTGRKLRKGEYDFEHVIALALWTGDGHGNRESNIRLAYRKAHREKTKLDRETKAQSDRVRKKHVLPRQPSRMQSAPFQKAAPRRSATTPVKPKYDGDRCFGARSDFGNTVFTDEEANSDPIR